MLNTITSSHVCKIKDISFRYDFDGSITPYLTIDPPLSTNTTIIKRISLCQPLKKITSLALNDTIRLTYASKNSLYIELLKPSEFERIDFTKHICPICHTPLNPANNNSVSDLGRCINRSCQAQLYNTLLFFLTAMGITLRSVIYKVLNSIITRKMFLYTPADLFFITESDLISSSVSIEDAHDFIFCIHSIRKHTSLNQIISALRIPDLDFNWINTFTSWYTEHHDNILQVEDYLDKDKQSDLPDLDWSSWNQFFSIPDNVHFLHDLLIYFDTSK